MACLFITETVSVYCAVRTKYLYILQITFPLQIQAPLACFSCSPPKINFKIFVQIQPSKRHHISSPCCPPQKKQNSAQISPPPPAAYPNSPLPITITFSLNKTFIPFFQPTLNRRTSGHCLGTSRTLTSPYPSAIIDIAPLTGPQPHPLFRLSLLLSSSKC